MVGFDILANTVAQRVLTQSNNISYAARGASRMNSIPDDRQADYFFRDFYMILVTGYFTEVGFRLLDTMLTIPKFTEAIGFNRMVQSYGMKPAPGQPTPLHGYFPDAKNYKNIPEIIRPRVLGSLVKDKGGSNDLIPKTLRDLDLPKMEERLAKLRKNGGSPAKISKLEVQINEAKLLSHHFRRFFDFKNYVTQNLVDLGTVDEDEAKQFTRLMDELGEKVDRRMKDLLHIRGRFAMTPEELARVQHGLRRFEPREADSLLKPSKPEELTRRVAAWLGKSEGELQRAMTPEKFTQLQKKLGAEIDKEYQKSLKKDPKQLRSEVAKLLHRDVAKLTEEEFAKGLEQLKAGRVDKGMAAKLVDFGEQALKKTGVDNLGDAVERQFLDKSKVTGKVRALLEEGLSNGRVRTALKAIQKNSAWPKMAIGVALGLVYFGVIANNFDTKILQPWQEKLVKERGTSREVVPPFYKALPAGAITLALLMSNKVTPFLRKLGYLGRFTFAGAAAMTVYTAMGLMGVKRALAKPPEHLPGMEEQPQLASLSQQPNALAGTLQNRPMGFQMFEMARQMGPSANPFTAR